MSVEVDAVQRIAVVGGNALSRAFVEALAELAERGLEVVAVVDVEADVPADVPAGVPVMAMEEMLALGEEVDIIFDLAGDEVLRRRLRQALFASDNRHTVIAPRSVAQLVWTLLGRQSFPRGPEGY